MDRRSSIAETRLPVQLIVNTGVIADIPGCC
jgi:hypothetical protein